MITIEENGDPEPTYVEEYRNRKDFSKWKGVIQAELNSLAKCKVFGPIVQTLNDLKLVGYKWVFLWTWNENNEVVRYKAWLVAQGFLERPDIDYKETYSPKVDVIMFRCLISLEI